MKVREPSRVPMLVATALAAARREYPSHVTHLLNGPAEHLSPRGLHPAFYGSFDWHSAVHTHWALLRLLRAVPQLPGAPDVRALLADSLSADAISGEVAYFTERGREGFERPYGLAWFLQLCTEIREARRDDPRDRSYTDWESAVVPLEELCSARLVRWLETQTFPVRTGEHGQTAFSTALLLDWARATRDEGTAERVRRRCLDLFLADRDAPLRYEPSGHDFLSPALAEGDLLRRILDEEAFAAWLGDFLPSIPREPDPSWLPVVLPADANDGKFAHFAGLELSRAWMLEGIASGLPEGDARREALLAAAEQHAAKGLQFAEHPSYMISHWIVGFAVYWMTQRGI